jgi:hypothetical protein
VTLFEKMPLQQALADSTVAPVDSEISNQLSLLGF